MEMAHEQQPGGDVTGIGPLSTDGVSRNIKLEYGSTADSFDGSEFVRTGILSESADVPPTGMANSTYEGAKDRLRKLEPTTSDDNRLSSKIINAQGYSIPPPSELQKEDLAVYWPSKVCPSVKEHLEQLKLVPMLFDRINDKTIDMTVKFGKREVAFTARLPLGETSEKPTINLRKRGIVTPEDVYLLLLIDVDYSNFAKNETESLYLQWMVQDVRLPSGSTEVDVVNRLGREMVEYTSCGKPGGVRGHVFLLYQQEKPLSSSVSGRIQREGFDPKAFLRGRKFQHPDPVVAFYYETE